MAKDKTFPYRVVLATVRGYISDFSSNQSYSEGEVRKYTGLILSAIKNKPVNYKDFAYEYMEKNYSKSPPELSILQHLRQAHTLASNSYPDIAQDLMPIIKKLNDC